MTDESMDALRAQLVRDLDDRQGPWLSRPLWMRLLVTSLPAIVAGTAAWAAFSPARMFGGSLWMLLVGGLLATLSFALATLRPSISERIAQTSIVVVVGAMVWEAAQASDTVASALVPCAATTTLFACLAAGPSILWVRQSAFPFRTWHVVALCASVLALSAVPVWRHCPSTERTHALFAHGLIPLVVGLLLGLAVRMLLSKTRA
jgi:hypothetical protein